MTIAQANALPRDEFVAAFGWLFEDSRWVAEQAWPHRPFADRDALHRALVRAVEAADRATKLALLRAHPDLGARARMSEASIGEQAGAGLDRMSPADYRRLQAMNRRYREKFGFPFLFAVKRSAMHDILCSLERRVEAAPEAEFQEALTQVYRIASFRLRDALDPTRTNPSTGQKQASRDRKGAIRNPGSEVGDRTMERFASGWKQNYYGKGDVIVYRLNRDGRVPEGRSPVFGANVKMLLYGDAFWPTYTIGDNANLVATDSMKNFIQRETLNYPGYDLESFCAFLATKFMETYPHTAGIQLSAKQVPYSGLAEGAVAFAPSGPDMANASVEIRRNQDALEYLEARSGIHGFRLLRLGGSAFHGFVRDQYTTLPDITNRPLNMWLDLDWQYVTAEAAFSEGRVTARVRHLVHQVFHSFESGSIQQVIYQLGTKMLEEIPVISEIHLEANNRTWDTIVEQGDQIGVYTDARPPYGCLGLALRR